MLLKSPPKDHRGTIDKLLIFLSLLVVSVIWGSALAQQDPVAGALHSRLEELQFAGDLQIAISIHALDGRGSLQDINLLGGEPLPMGTVYTLSLKASAAPAAVELIPTPPPKTPMSAHLKNAAARPALVPQRSALWKPMAAVTRQKTTWS